MMEWLDQLIAVAAHVNDVGAGDVIKLVIGEKENARVQSATTVVPTWEVLTNSNGWMPVSGVDLSTLAPGTTLSCKFGEWTHEYTLDSDEKGTQLNRATGTLRPIRRIGTGDATSRPMHMIKNVLPQKRERSV